MYNLRTKVVEESIHAIFNEKDNGILSEGFKNLKLCHDDDEDKTKKENGTNMQAHIQALDVANLETDDGSQGHDNINQEPEPRE